MARQNPLYSSKGAVIAQQLCPRPCQDISRDLKLAALPPSQQAAACLLYVAGESQRRHLITESEAIITRCLRVEASTIRSLYSTDIKFALGNWFFDDDSESSPVGNGPPAGKRNKKSTAGPSTSRQAMLDEHLLVDEICGEENFVIVTDDSPIIGGAGSATPRLLNQQRQAVRKVHESDQFFTSPAASRPKRTSSPPSLIKFSNDDETDYVNSPGKATYFPKGTTSLYCEEQFTSDSVAILAPVPPPLADNLPLGMLPSVTLTKTHGSATHSNEGDDSGFNSIVSTPEMSQTTTTIVSTAPTSSITYCNAPLGSMAAAAGWPQGHQGLGQLWEQL
ncbi:hypothetical protein DdX_05731 [Ditylenchus destructor]|uniref:Uncharacterized protein n=1 Tax=Ditylenchus destructor TaxID=166010 RepID=A0AAD4N844_9BILA|nr:hypothetical protein DdX_05731 [Ditylenchus destructor]